MTDPRHYCRDCLNLNKQGLCMAATKLGASTHYRPMQDMLRNCAEFKDAVALKWGDMPPPESQHGKYARLRLTKG